MTISKVCEDAYSELSREVYGHPVNFLVPKLLTFFSHSEPNIRRLALHSVVSLLQTSRAPEDGDAGVMNAILANIDPFLQVYSNHPSFDMFVLPGYICSCQ